MENNKEYFKSIIDKLDETDYKKYDDKHLDGKVIIALLVEQNATLALMCNLLAQALYANDKPEKNIIHCPKCGNDVIPNDLNYCPKCKEDLAKYVKLIKPD